MKVIYLGCPTHTQIPFSILNTKQINVSVDQNGSEKQTSGVKVRNYGLKCLMPFWHQCQVQCHKLRARDWFCIFLAGQDLRLPG